MEDEYLSKCVIDMQTKTFHLYSDKGTEKKISCDDIEEFMNILEYTRSVLTEDTLFYSELK